VRRLTEPPTTTKIFCPSRTHWRPHVSPTFLLDGRRRRSPFPVDQARWPRTTASRRKTRTWSSAHGDSWPRRDSGRGSIRTQWHHVVDLTPDDPRGNDGNDDENCRSPRLRLAYAETMEGVSAVYAGLHRLEMPRRRQPTTNSNLWMFGNRAHLHTADRSDSDRIPGTFQGAGRSSPRTRGEVLTLTTTDFSQFAGSRREKPDKLSELQRPLARGGRKKSTTIAVADFVVSSVCPDTGG